MTEQTLVESTQNLDHLLDFLRHVDVTVPGRTERRKNEDRERWTICRLIATLGRHGQLAFPVSLFRRSPPHPDYRLLLADRIIGIEVTEATYQDYNRCLDLQAKEYPGSVLDVGLFVPARYDAEGKRIPVQECVYRSQLERNEIVSEGWSCAEPDWVRAIRGTIDHKQKSLIDRYRHESHTNWLAIESNLPCDHIDLDEAANALSENLTHYWDQPHHFERIFIARGNAMVTLSSGTCFQLNVNDLWRPSTLETLA